MWRDILKANKGLRFAKDIRRRTLETSGDTPEGEQLRNIQYNLNEIVDEIGYPKVSNNDLPDDVRDLHADDRKVFTKILKDIDYREDKTVTFLEEESIHSFVVIRPAREYAVDFLMTPRTGIYLKMTLTIKTSDRLKQANPDFMPEDKTIFHYEIGSKTKPNYEQLLEEFNDSEEVWDDAIDELFWRMGRKGEEHGFTFKDIKIYSDPKLRFRGGDKVKGQEGEVRDNWWS